jgi:pimeloyl-ACP methyl ester carboxylesterase
MTTDSPTAAATPTTRLRLADGRSLDLWYDDNPGAEALTPLVFHAGTPTSGLPYEAFVRAARERGLRSIGWSRPGYGSSTRQRGRSVADIVPDTAAVLDHLGAGPAYVVGHSGGGPHALACAALLGDRVLGVALIAGVAPFEAEGLDFLEGMGQENHDEFGAATRSEAELAARHDRRRRRGDVRRPRRRRRPGRADRRVRRVRGGPDGRGPA